MIEPKNVKPGNLIRTVKLSDDKGIPLGEPFLRGVLALVTERHHYKGQQAKLDGYVKVLYCETQKSGMFEICRIAEVLK